MRIWFFALYPRAAASSRLRAYRLAEEIDRIQGNSAITALVGRDNASSIAEMLAVGIPDVVVAQKCSSPIRPPNSRAKIVVDYDDNLPKILEYGASATDAVTVDTFARLQHVRAVNCWTKSAFEIPDMIDYEPTEPLPAAEEISMPCWFGNHGNFNCADVFSAINGPWGYICDRPFGGSGPKPTVSMTYDYERFPVVLRTFGVAVMSHAGQDPCKSNNKLIAAVTLGVPCIVAQSIAYEEILRQCDLAEFIVRRPADVRDCMRELATQAGRQAYLDKIQPYVWQHFRGEVVAQKALAVYKQILEGR